MQRSTRFLSTVGLLFLLALYRPPPASATAIQYQAIDLLDSSAGQDLWRYEYSVTDRVFAEDQGFSIYFDPTLYTSLLAGPAPSDWDVLVLQPDLTLPSAGLYDALALVSGASLAQPFAVSFVWLGPSGSAPAEQFFEVYELDSTGTLRVLESGSTSPLDGTTPVPEPSTWLLLACGVTLALWRRRPQA